MSYFNSEEKEKIKQAIHGAEQETSGEIRVCVEKKCKSNPLDRAAYFFKKLKMHETRERNGVLIYLSTEDKKFAIIGDAAFHQKNGDAFWEDARDSMLNNFKTGKILDGVLTGVAMTGKRMKSFFPHLDTDVNELPDDLYDADEL